MPLMPFEKNANKIILYTSPNKNMQIFYHPCILQPNPINIPTPRLQTKTQFFLSLYVFDKTCKFSIPDMDNLCNLKRKIFEISKSERNHPIWKRKLQDTTTYYLRISFTK